MGRLFDHLNLLAPLTFQGKALIQLLWRENNGWDQPAPEVIAKRLKRYLLNHKYTKHISIPRHLGMLSEDQAKLIVFADASMQAVMSSILDPFPFLFNPNPLGTGFGKGA